MKRRMVLGLALLALGVAGIVACLFAWHAFAEGEAAARANAESDVVELHVEVACDGWTSAYTSLGVFVSGTSFDGVPCDEQFMFDGSGQQVAALSAGSYEVVPQLPLLMLADGTVLAASEPLEFYYEPGEAACDRALVSYAPFDPRALTEAELDDAAATSFFDEETAALALERARAQRQEGTEDV